KSQRAAGGPEADPRMPMSSGFFAEVKEKTTSFASLAAFRAWTYALSLRPGEAAEQVRGVRATPSLFTALGVKPYAGRVFTDDDAQPGAPHVAVLSHDVWQRKFGGEQSAVGRTVRMNGESFTIVGIMPPGFTFPRGAELPAGLQFHMRAELWA